MPPDNAPVDTTKDTIMIDIWDSCYNLSWKGIITAESFSHPAKFSHALIRRIYQHIIAEGWVKQGDVILDPFGGVGLGGWAATNCGLSWIGVELEERFCTLARHNFIEWSERFWCTCGKNGNDYLYSMRETVSEKIKRDDEKEATKDRPVLQPGMPEQVSMFRQETFPAVNPETKGTQALEQRETLESRGETETITSINEREQGEGKEWKLEEGTLDSSRWLYRNQSRWETETGTPACDGIIPEKEIRQERISSSQKWGQARQPFGESEADDNFGTYERTSPAGDKETDEEKELCDLSENIPEQQQNDYLQSAMQAAADSRVLAATRYKTEGNTCKDCGKLIVSFPIILQGDSRKLGQVIGQAMAVISSPPFVDTEPTRDDNFRYNGKKLGSTGNHYGNSPGQLGQMQPGDISAIISSPPFAGNSGGRGEASRNGIDAALFDRHSGGMKKGTGESEGNLDHLPMGSVGVVISSPPFCDNGMGDKRPFGGIADKKEHWNEQTGAGGITDYGSSDGQLGSMPSGNIQAIISSPPFADSVGSDDPDKRGGLYRDPKRRNDTNLSGTYGDTEGQLGAMRDGGIAAVVGSPPYAESNQDYQEGYKWAKPQGGMVQANYGQSPNQLGNESGETFWQAAAAIVQQCAMVLPSGGHCVWVVKDYVKKGKIVPFSEQWAQLCEACGFELVHIHRAMLVKNRGVNQVTIEGEDVSKETARKSFFRLLAERKGSPKIDWETVLCFRRK